MLARFKDLFSPEKEEQVEKFVRRTLAKEMEQKKCRVCENTYREFWNNHGHEDYTLQCNYTHECVDFKSGKKCPNFKPRCDLEEEGDQLCSTFS